mgnify:CR=1 FL=1
MSESYPRRLLREPSTWRGLIWTVAGLFGLSLSAGQVETLISVAMLGAGLVGATALDASRSGGDGD